MVSGIDRVVFQHGLPAKTDADDLAGPGEVADSDEVPAQFDRGGQFSMLVEGTEPQAN